MLTGSLDFSRRPLVSMCRNVRISEAPSHGLPVILYDENSTGSVAYKELSNEILSQKDLDIEAA